MKNSLFSFDKYQKVILNDSASLMQSVFSLSAFNLPLFFIFPSLISLALFGMSFIKLIFSKQFSWSECLKYFAFFISYLFLFPFFFTLFNDAFCEESNFLLVEHPMLNKYIQLRNYFISFILINLFSFLLNDYFASKYFLKW